MVYVSMVIPMYNEGMNAIPMYEKLTKVLKDLKKDYEIVFIDDGSRDKTFVELEKLHKADKKVKVISFRRNFGKAAALSAGFQYAKGEIVITMDGDLQDEPEEIPRFLDAIKDYDLVSGWKPKKHKGSLRALPSRIFNMLTRTLTSLHLHDFNCPFKAYRKEVVKDLNLYGEMHRYIPVLAFWKGYRITEIRVLNYPRRFGKTKYGSGRLLKGIFDLVTITYLTSFRIRPLHFFGKVGLVFFGLGFVAGLYLFSHWLRGMGIGSRPLLMLAVLLMFLGAQFVSMGLIAEMLTNINEKQEKSYSIRKVLG